MSTSKTSKPKWLVGWDVDDRIVRSRYTTDDWQKIENVIASAGGKESIHPSARPYIRDQVTSEAYFYLIERQNVEGRPIKSEVRARIKRVRERVLSLTDAINGLDDLTLFYLVREFTRDNTPVNLSEPMALEIDDLFQRNRDDASQQLSCIGEVGRAAERLLVSLPGQSGPQPDWPLGRYIRCMTTTFKAWTGLKTAKVSYNDYADPPGYYGPLFDFIEACLRPIDPEACRSNPALGEKIRRALGLRKRKTRTPK